MLIDTHCHIHEKDYRIPVSDALAHAQEAHVEKMICVGTNEQSSEWAVTLAEKYEHLFASIGVHPHDTAGGYAQIEEMARVKRSSKLVAIGEIGLDYFYTHSPRDVQLRALESQIHTALESKLPIIFHVREAFDDFWPVFDNFHGIRGELHSFTDTQVNLEQALARGLYIGVNGISTFTKDESQKAMFTQIPVERLLLETDAPFLTPTPKRGKVNEPAFVRYVAQHHADIRGMQFDEIATATSANATALFAL